jgi:cyclopropane fatty-acyl-phospholipid synthase-like methyltransferase
MHTPNHLGGHGGRTHVDEGTLTFLKETIAIKSMLDIGCGPGGMSYVAKDLDIIWLGIDGDLSLARFSNSNIISHDFTLGPISNSKLIVSRTEKTFMTKEFDLAWSVEFLEHVGEKFIPNYMSAFQKCRWVVCTHAPITATNGHHHVNLRDDRYWIRRFSEHGFTFDKELSRGVRMNSTMEREFMRNTGLVFKRT